MTNAAIPDLSQLRLDDVRKFLDVHQYADSQPRDRRSSFRLLFSEFGPHTTTVQQLGRVADFFFGQNPRQGRTGLDRLFCEKIDGNGLQPTEDADELARQLDVFINLSQRLRDQFRVERPDFARPVIRLGCIGALGMRLVPAALSHWRSAFGGKDVDLRMTINASKILIPQLHAGLLDMVLAYGTGNGVVPDNAYDISFASLGHLSRMTLLAHPKAQLWLANGTDKNAGYWEELFGKKSSTHAMLEKKRSEITFEQLREIDLEELDFRRTLLIAVPSWRHPRPLEEMILKLRRMGGEAVCMIDSYDHALAMAQLGLGVAVATESFSKRGGVTAFRLAPEPSYERWIGVYYNTRQGLSGHGACLAEFLRSYIEKFGESNMRKAETPAIGDTDYDDWCRSLTSEEWVTRKWEEWEAFAKKHYPAPGSRVKGGTGRR